MIPCTECSQIHHGFSSVPIYAFLVLRLHCSQDQRYSTEELVTAHLSHGIPYAYSTRTTKSQSKKICITNQNLCRYQGVSISFFLLLHLGTRDPIKSFLQYVCSTETQKKACYLGTLIWMFSQLFFPGCCVFWQACDFIFSGNVWCDFVSTSSYR